MNADRTGAALPKNAEDEDWNRLAAEQLLSGYRESDSVYDAVERGDIVRLAFPFSAE